MKRIYIVVILQLSVFCSCKKYLDKKSLQNLYVPATIRDLQAMLDNSTAMNRGFGNSLVELIGDNYYVSTADWINSSPLEKSNYVWDIAAVDPNSWRLPYTGPIYYSNFVLDALKRIKDNGNDSSLRHLEGAALFYRSFAFNHLAQLYCKPYSQQSNSDIGIVLKLTSAIENKANRSSVFATYNQIIQDIKLSYELLPENSSLSLRPNKSAAFALLARVYLNMGEYRMAEQFSDSALKRNSKLLNFSSLMSGLPDFEVNPEILFFGLLGTSNITARSVAKIDSVLLSTYSANDIRKRLFFQQNTGVNSGTYRFKGSYYPPTSGGSTVFYGLTTAEIYLIKAECLARRNMVSEAMSVLNKLLINRWDEGTFSDRTANSKEEAIQLILVERRKELVYRGLRWSDIRRLNIEGGNISLKRILNNVEYVLPANDLRSVMLIPEEEISISGIQQNPR